MANYKTKGIILKRTNFGEADRLLTIFSNNHGKIRALAKGVRKQKSKMAGHLEPFCLTNLVLAEGRNFDIVTEAETIECFFGLRNDLKKTNLSYYFSDLTDSLTAENENHPELFDLLVENLSLINRVPQDLLIAYFEINLLSDLGFNPELYNCVHCRKKLVAGLNYFDFNAGGVACPACSKNGLKISQETIKLLRLLLHKKASLLLKLSSLSNDELKETNNIVRTYLNTFHQQVVKSQRFIN